MKFKSFRIVTVGMLAILIVCMCSACSSQVAGSDQVATYRLLLPVVNGQA